MTDPADAKRRLLVRFADRLHAPDTKPARRPPARASAPAGLIMARIAQKTRFADPGLVRAWATIVGAEIAALCRPGKISGGRRDRTFEVYVPDGAAATQLALMTNDLLEKLNAYYGPGIIGRVKVRQTGRRAAPPPSGGGLSRFRNPDGT